MFYSNRLALTHKDQTDQTDRIYERHFKRTNDAPQIDFRQWLNFPDPLPWKICGSSGGSKIDCVLLIL